jgi:glycosyltransferase involved in cell wall biosynthesis
MELMESFKLSPDNIVIAIVGRFQRIKGHITFLRAAHEIARKIPDAVFLVVGENVFGVQDDEINYREINEFVARDPLLQKSVKFIPFQKDISRLFSIVDILVSASESETFGMVHLEAMACGRVVVSTNVGGPAEIVKDGETGYLFSPGDFASLVEKVVVLCHDTVLRKHLGEMGRKRAMENFAINQQTCKYREIVYDTLEVGK